MTQGGFSADSTAINQQATYVRQRSTDASNVASGVTGGAIDGNALGQVGSQTAQKVQQMVTQAQQAVTQASSSLQKQSDALTRTATNYNQADGDNAQRLRGIEVREPSAGTQPQSTTTGGPATQATKGVLGSRETIGVTAPQGTSIQDRFPVDQPRIGVEEPMQQLQPRIGTVEPMQPRIGTVEPGQPLQPRIGTVEPEQPVQPRIGVEEPMQPFQPRIGVTEQPRIGVEEPMQTIQPRIGTVEPEQPVQARLPEAPLQPEQIEQPRIGVIEPEQPAFRTTIGVTEPVDTTAVSPARYEQD